MINNFLSCAWIYILESFHHHRRPWFENLLKISMNLKDSTNFQIYFFTPIPPLKSSFLSIWTKKKKKKRKSLPARYLNLNSRNERDSTHKAREESLTSFRRYFIKYMADDVKRERERERERDRFYISHHPSLIEGEKKSVRGRGNFSKNEEEESSKCNFVYHWLEYLITGPTSLKLSSIRRH